jgi:hypothetical protein
MIKSKKNYFWQIEWRLVYLEFYGENASAIYVASNIKKMKIKEAANVKDHSRPKAYRQKYLLFVSLLLSMN